MQNLKTNFNVIKSRHQKVSCFANKIMCVIERETEKKDPILLSFSEKKTLKIIHLVPIKKILK